jgi:hypothetical protein
VPVDDFIVVARTRARHVARAAARATRTSVSARSPACCAVPNHACATAAQFAQYVVVDGRSVRGPGRGSPLVARRG